MDELQILKSNHKPTVLFLQWQYEQHMDVITALKTRQVLESKIDEALRKLGQGEWISGDMGVGGANMEFGIKVDQKKALKTIIAILRDEHLDKEAVIASDINYVANRWAYKILYPENYIKAFDPS